ncbi:hypothetical protein IEQ34_014128 [Dendrobium chrysotoxum]|uniref:Uncharacterized protein n=1 Tax=Dendrobium chrysotoxum TaxID=161865 RepID=A0AAV7GIC9_DENCH|nr:hypothetical protein IEQ34_014128 [Dendrobium chrysotoxum]
MVNEATSCARAAISAVGKVPSQMRDFFFGSRISETHLPQLRMRTPRYVGCLPSLLRFLGLMDSSGFGEEKEEEQEEEEVEEEEGEGRDWH